MARYEKELWNSRLSTHCCIHRLRKVKFVGCYTYSSKMITIDVGITILSDIDIPAKCLVEGIQSLLVHFLAKTGT